MRSGFGLLLLLLNFWPQISAVPLAVQTLSCLGTLVAYTVPCVLILLPVRFLTNVPSFVFRKMLHIVGFSCFVVMVLSSESWQAATLTSIIIVVLIYPLLSLVEGQSWYGKLFVQKSRGEVKRSLLMLFFMFAAVIAVAWGVFGKPHIAAAAILMWGMGDAAAALVGIPFGKHKIRFKPINGRKSWEGSIAMLVVSLLAGTALLWLYHGVSPDSVMLPVLIASLMGTIVEMLSPSEWDTVTVPIVILGFLMIMDV